MSPTAGAAATMQCVGADRSSLLRRGLRLEYATLGWNAVGIAVLGVAAIAARSVALAGFGLDSLIEIGASTVVVWELSGTNAERERRALRMVGIAFLALAAYLVIQAAVVLAVRHHAAHSPLGIAWTAASAVVMFGLAAGKARTGRALGNPVLGSLMLIVRIFFGSVGSHRPVPEAESATITLTASSRALIPPPLPRPLR